MSKTIYVLAAVILSSLPCAAIADGYPNVPVPIPPAATPQRMSPRQIFQWLDTNHDGYLSLDEFLAAPWIQNKQRAAAFFRWMDTNQDGLVSLEEFLAAYTRYSGNSGYWIRTAYPWAWNCWRPWRSGWYWQNGWQRRPGAWSGYAGYTHARVVGSHYPGKYHAGKVHPGKHAGGGKHHHAVKHVKPAKAKHHGKHKGPGHGHASHGHGHAHGHAGHHGKHR